MDRPCFIYAIVHVASGDRYVGSTVVISERWAAHRCDLRHNRHHCVRLQKAWNKFGESTFEFRILRKLPSNDRPARYAAELAAIAEGKSFNSRQADLGATNFVNDLATRNKIALGIKMRMIGDAEYREWLTQRGKSLAAHARTPERRAVRAVLAKEQWKDPEHRKRVSSSLAIHWNSMATCEEHSKRVKLHRSTPEARQANSEAMKQAWADLAGGHRNRKQTRWADPKAKARQAEKMRAIWAKRRQAQA